ncbi:amino acid ABC transporter permease [Candidatus Bipolaricaulota bacterium]
MNDLVKTLPILFQGLGMTLLLLTCSLGIGFVLGIPIGILNVFGPMPVRLVLKGFDLVMRGFPAIVLLFLVYFGLGRLEGIHLTSLQAAILALGLRSAAYQGQLVRGAIEMVDLGQLEAARALGLPLLQAIRCVVLPQAIRFSLPSLANEYSVVLKDTALAFTVGVLEMMSRAKFLAASTREITLVYVAVAIVYWVLTQIGLLGFYAIERGTRIPGVGADNRRSP